MTQTPFPRNANTMSEAIALSSPSGRLSKRARKAAESRLSAALFPPGYWEWANAKPEPEPAVVAAELRGKARFLRSLLTSKGKLPLKFRRQAEAYEAEAEGIISGAQA